MNAFKVEILVIDFDGLGADGIAKQFDTVSFPNDCVTLCVKAITGKDIGEWSDAHPLNKAGICDAEYRRLFPANPLSRCSEPKSRDIGPRDPKATTGRTI